MNLLILGLLIPAALIVTLFINGANKSYNSSINTFIIIAMLFMGGPFLLILGGSKGEFLLLLLITVPIGAIAGIVLGILKIVAYSKKQSQINTNIEKKKGMSGLRIAAWMITGIFGFSLISELVMHFTMGNEISFSLMEHSWAWYYIYDLLKTAIVPGVFWVIVILVEKDKRKKNYNQVDSEQ